MAMSRTNSIGFVQSQVTPCRFQMQVSLNRFTGGKKKTDLKGKAMGMLFFGHDAIRTEKRNSARTSPCPTPLQRPGGGGGGLNIEVSEIKVFTGIQGTMLGF